MQNKKAKRTNTFLKTLILNLNLEMDPKTQQTTAVIQYAPHLQQFFKEVERIPVYI